MSVTADFSEVAALASTLDAAGPKVEKLSSASLSKIASKLRSDAVGAAPVATGELRASIYLRGAVDVRYVGSDVKQGFFQEFGTSVMPPQPWLFPAASVAQSTLYREFEKLGDPFD